MATMRTLFIGDVVGLPGRAMVQKHLAHLKKELAIDVVIVNVGRGNGAKDPVITWLEFTFVKTY